jgi:hypothetical protein
MVYCVQHNKAYTLRAISWYVMKLIVNAICWQSVENVKSSVMNTAPIHQTLYTAHIYTIGGTSIARINKVTLAEIPTKSEKKHLMHTSNSQPSKS